MPRKKWVARTEITPDLTKSREKRKWQIALRRYVVEQHLSKSYAPYFGLDIASLRSWFESQFDGVGWDDFGSLWQFEHIIPVTLFDFNQESELKLCWHFLNMGISITNSANSAQEKNGIDLLLAKQYFTQLYATSGYEPCLQYLAKIEQIENAHRPGTSRQATFIKNHEHFLTYARGFGAFEFERLNTGSSLDQVTKEVDFLKKF
ncbi:MAG: hypothetical protein ABIU63_02770 [Chitinophagaceae bacterium]